MVDILIQPNADDDDDLTNGIVIDDASLPLSAQDAVALGLTLGTTYKAGVVGTRATFTVTDVPAQMSAPTATSVSETSISVTRAADPATNGAAITGYKLRYSTDEATWTTVAMTTNPQAVSGLAEATLYYFQTTATNANGDGEWSTSDTETTTADSSAPTLSSPVDAANGATAATGSVDTDEGNGTLYWVVTQSATPPSAAQVIAGNDHTGSAADDAGSQSVSSVGTQTLSPAPSGLTASTTYYLHFAHVDAASNESAVASGDGFTTAAASPPTAWDASLTLAASKQARIDPYRSAGAAAAVSAFDRSEGADNNENMTIDSESSSNGTVSVDGSAVVYPAGNTAGALVYTPPASGGDTVSYNVNQDGSSDTGTLTITTEANNGYSYPEIAVATDYIDHAGPLHSADVTDFTIVFLAKMTNNSGTKMILAGLDGANAELFSIIQVGGNIRVAFAGTTYAFNNGATTIADQIAVVVTGEDIGGSESRIRMKWKRPDSNWFDAVNTTRATYTLPASTITRHTVFRKYNASLQWPGTFTHLIGWPATLDLDNATHLAAVMSPGGQPVNPTAVDGILGSRMSVLDFASLADLAAADGTTFTV